ncbi:uncharacterized protein LOC122501309 [Leptopilina heterotoma]|uniref:uncharacterized protein LOC122501309 n=1 Tax=Leptopilina heterotoma TaxID=63436 RepID=UPI001CA7C355|nr:uncharacterized protein LOC122501309 [Leptopilina heterotoma]
MGYVVDIQCFKRPYNEFVIKELAILPLQQDAHPLVYLFEPPYAWSRLPARYKCENRWLTNNYHGIDWAAGDVSYEKLQPIIKEVLIGTPTIYVKGLEKQKWLEKYTSNVFNLDDFKCPSLKSFSVESSSTCTNHTRSFSNCAVKNVCNLRNWLIQPSNVLRNNIENNDEVDNDCTLKDFYNDC